MKGVLIFSQVLIRSTDSQKGAISLPIFLLLIGLLIELLCLRLQPSCCGQVGLAGWAPRRGCAALLGAARTSAPRARGDAASNRSLVSCAAGDGS